MCYPTAHAPKLSSTSCQVGLQAFAPLYHTFREQWHLTYCSSAAVTKSLGSRQITYPPSPQRLTACPLPYSTSDVDYTSFHLAFFHPFLLVKKIVKHRRPAHQPRTVFPYGFTRVESACYAPDGISLFPTGCAIYGNVYPFVPWRKAYQRFGHQSGGI